MDFVDGELPEALRGAVLSHADLCPQCRKELREIERVRKLSAGLPPVTVSPEFDFRLKASLRMEAARLRSPLYRMRLFLRENLLSAVAVPAVIALFLGGMVYYQSPLRHAAPVIAGRMAPAAESGQNTAEAPPAEAVDVEYVLESLNVSETGIEVTSAGKPGVSAERPDMKIVSSIKF